jgi:hypothetical protein
LKVNQLQTLRWPARTCLTKRSQQQVEASIARCRSALDRICGCEVVHPVDVDTDALALPLASMIVFAALADQR